jgi:hypothetical protein
MVLRISGDTLKGEVVSLDAASLTLDMSGSGGAADFRVPRAELYMIRYSNGITEYFRKPAEKWAMDPATSTDTSIYRQGARDAHRYYMKYKDAATGTIIVSLVYSPVFGLIPAIACSASAPEDKYLKVPDKRLLDNEGYMQGYRQEAKKIKSAKVWKNWGIGTGIYAGFIAMIAVLGNL